MRTVGNAGTDCSGALCTVAANYFPPPVTAQDVPDWTSGPVPEYGGPTDDTELIAKAIGARSAASKFGNGCTLADLWNCNVEALAKAYPTVSGSMEYDASAADAALAQHLAFWTGKDCERMERLMRKSCLVRDKWDSHGSYLERTITRAVSLQKKVFSKPQLEAVLNREAPKMAEGYQFLGAPQQIEHFKGCVYVQDINRVFAPNGALLNKEQFNATYGGYLFQMDDGGSKTTRKAFEAFTESLVVRFPKVESTCFRPKIEPGAILEHEGRRLVNTYVPVPTEQTPGDVTPFLNHLNLVLPENRDRAILLAYMAACVQHIGTKFQWAPLIQGAEGNGKSLFSYCVAYAIGEKYVHMPPASEIGEKFNSWMFDKLFIGVEDIYVPDQKRELVEILKPMITGKRLPCRAMQQAQVMKDSCANFIFNSNHQDGVRKTVDDRRYCVLFTAQQSFDDIRRDGMNGGYFPRLYDWLNSGGYAAVNYYLRRYEIPDMLNPAKLCSRAPETSTTQVAIAAGLGRIEQEVLEAVEQETLGFKKRLDLIHSS